MQYEKYNLYLADTQIVSLRLLAARRGTKMAEFIRSVLGEYVRAEFDKIKNQQPNQNPTSTGETNG